jgi:hypothetical protein
MESAIGTWRPESCERVWLVQWRLVGHGPLFAELHGAKLQRELAERCRGPAGVHLEQTFELSPQMEAARDDDLQREFRRLWEERPPADRRAVEDALTRSGVDGSQWALRLQALLPDLDPAAISEQARHYGMTWLQ